MSLRSLAFGVWSHSGVWWLKSGVILESGYWSLVSLRSLESGVWSHSGVWCAEVWSHSGVWSLESGVTPESGG